MPDLIEHVRGAMGKPHHVFTGRASTALYLYLRQHGIEGREIALPVNICYSLVQPVRMTGNRPVFFDVDALTANPGRGHVEALATKPHAVVVAHMYGNPCAEIESIADWCRARDVVLIEDCAAGFHGPPGGPALGSFGDFALLSFGAGKTVDATCGGLLASSAAPLEDARRLNESLPMFGPDLAERTELYSSLFRTIYHGGYLAELSGPLGAFNPYFEDIHRYRMDPAGVKRVLRTYEAFDEEASRRLRIVEVYENELPFGPVLQRYPLVKGCVPWRFNVLVRDPTIRKSLIFALVADGVRVGAWYPPIAGLFGVRGTFPGAESFAAAVLNLPLDGDERHASAVAERIRRVMEGASGK